MLLLEVNGSKFSEFHLKLLQLLTIYNKDIRSLAIKIYIEDDQNEIKVKDQVKWNL